MIRALFALASARYSQAAAVTVRARDANAAHPKRGKLAAVHGCCRVRCRAHLRDHEPCDADVHDLLDPDLLDGGHSHDQRAPFAGCLREPLNGRQVKAAVLGVKEEPVEAGFGTHLDQLRRRKGDEGGNQRLVRQQTTPEVRMHDPTSNPQHTRNPANISHR
jgi:hypothetical protein